MNALDAGVFVVILGLGLLGFKRGFARELVETFGAIVTAVIACMVVITIAGRLLARFLRSVSLGMYDHLAGFVLGALRGFPRNYRLCRRRTYSRLAFGPVGYYRLNRFFQGSP